MQHSEKTELKRALKLKHTTIKVQDPPKYSNYYIKTILSVFGWGELGFGNGS
jgi:hypothetical protein